MESWRKELYLEHHGILGQKWGKRNGPPYPLGASNHSASEKKAGWRKSLDKDNAANYTKSSSSGNNGIRLTENQKKALKIGAAVAVTALAAYGAYRLNQSGKLSQFVGTGRDAVDSMIGGNGETSASYPFFPSGKGIIVSSQTGLKMKLQRMSAQEDAVAANPDYDRNNPVYQNNCGHSCIAYALRRMGLDVKAKPMEGEQIQNGMSEADIGRYFKMLISERATLKDTSSSAACRKSLSKELLAICDNENGAFGMLALEWSDQPGTGHWIAWENRNGNIIFTDPQLGLGDAEHCFKKITNGSFRNFIRIERLDDLDVKTEFIHEVVRNK